MSYREDKIRLLEIICADMLPAEVSDGSQEVTVDQNDLEKEGLSFNAAVILIKDLFETNLIRKLNFSKPEEKVRKIYLTVDDDIQGYTKRYKYPETEFIDDWDNSYSVSSSGGTKMAITIHEVKGIYRNDNPNLCYNIKSGSKRVAIISYLVGRDRVSVSDLEKAIDQNSTLVIKEIRQINSNFKTKLSVVDDLVIHLPTSGYRLNKDKFDIAIQK